MSRENGEAYAVIKGSMPTGLKLRFKILCAQHGLNMTEVLETLIRQWVQAGGPTSSFVTNWLDDNREDVAYVKGYISFSLKAQFKVLSIQRELKQSFILYNIIREWVETNHESVNPFN